MSGEEVIHRHGIIKRPTLFGIFWLYGMGHIFTWNVWYYWGMDVYICCPVGVDSTKYEISSVEQI